MKSTKLAVLFLAILVLSIPTSQALAEASGTAFTYQGRLTLSGGVVTQSCDFLFSLYSQSPEATKLASTGCKTDLPWSFLLRPDAG
jgi:type 1 fimbria pilin